MKFSPSTILITIAASVGGVQATGCDVTVCNHTPGNWIKVGAVESKKLDGYKRVGAVKRNQCATVKHDAPAKMLKVERGTNEFIGLFSQNTCGCTFDVCGHKVINRSSRKIEAWIPALDDTVVPIVIRPGQWKIVVGAEGQPVHIRDAETKKLYKKYSRNGCGTRVVVKESDCGPKPAPPTSFPTRAPSVSPVVSIATQPPAGTRSGDKCDPVCGSLSGCYLFDFKSGSEMPLVVENPASAIMSHSLAVRCEVDGLIGHVEFVRSDGSVMHESSAAPHWIMGRSPVDGTVGVMPPMGLCDSLEFSVLGYMSTDDTDVCFEESFVIQNECSESPTANPSESPSTAPTGFPTKIPTPSPSGNPSESPSKSPTVAPSAPPSKAPTKSPTKSPTSSPSDPPSMIRTKTPTTSPTVDPSESPSDTPTDRPSDSPSNAPTTSPTKSPTASPSYSPSEAPTKSPTANPSESPSKDPTASPSELPSYAPTASPTELPTAEPSDSATTLPTASPSESPSKTPTKSPTASPSESPSNAPTPSPMASPSKSPSKTPTLPPTTSPSEPPSKKPTESPTKAPTSSPTSLTRSGNKPSLSPTVVPNPPPTASPTCVGNHPPTNVRSGTVPTAPPTEAPLGCMVPSHPRMCYLWSSSLRYWDPVPKGTKIEVSTYYRQKFVFKSNGDKSSTVENVPYHKFHSRPFYVRFSNDCGSSLWVQCKNYTPIGLDTDNSGAVEHITGQFKIDITGDGEINDLQEWFAPTEGILIDTSHGIENGVVTGQHLFGDEGGTYADGFDKLEEHDDDGDGVIKGPELNGFMIWTDSNSNTILDDGELSTLESHGIVSLNTMHEDMVSHATLEDGSKMRMEDLWFSR